MRCPNLGQLPAPPLGKTGWPWTVESEPFPEFMPDGRPWPRISIVTPSYNQGEFIEESMRSVLLQGYPSIEFIVNDGGSEDQSVQIIKKYENWLSSWQSGPDGGQSEAINKGLAKATGEIWMYLNSDDCLAPGALSTAAEAFAHPNVDWASGAALILHANGQCTGEIRPRNPSSLKGYIAPWARTSGYAFPFSGACLMRRKIFETIGGFDESLHFSMDMEYYARALFIGGFKQMIIDDVLAYWKVHSETKTSTGGCAYGFRRDEIEIARRYVSHIPLPDRLELIREIESQSRLLPTREAMWLVRTGQRRRALMLALSALPTSPSLLMSRPWLGAVRRAIVGR